MNFFKSHHVNKLVRNKGKRQTLLAQWVKNPKGGTIYLNPKKINFLKLFINGEAAKQAKIFLQNVRFRKEVLILLHYFSISRASTLCIIVQKMTETDWLLKTSVCYEKGTTWGIWEQDFLRQDIGFFCTEIIFFTWVMYKNIYHTQFYFIKRKTFQGLQPTMSWCTIYLLLCSTKEEKNWTASIYNLHFLWDP